MVSRKVSDQKDAGFCETCRLGTANDVVSLVLFHIFDISSDLQSTCGITHRFHVQQGMRRNNTLKTITHNDQKAR